MPRILVNGVDLHLQHLAPRGAPDARAAHPTAVFLHGFGVDSLASVYLTLGAAARAAGIEVIAYDLRGHGRSGRPPTGYRVSDFTADLAGLLDALEVAGPVHLVGNSFGATVAFSYALAAPERVASLVMIESEPATAEWARKMARTLHAITTPAHHPDVVDWFAERYGTRPAWLVEATTSWLSTMADRLGRTSMAHEIPSGPVLSREQIQSVRCPVLAILGSESDSVNQADLESLLPGCRIAVVPGQEHSVLVKAPHAVRDLVLAWIAEQHQVGSTGLASARVGET